MPIHRINRAVFDFYPREAHVDTKISFIIEGHARHTLIWDGGYHDSILMSIVRPDWEAERATRTLRP